MSPQPQSEILQMLEASREELHSAVSGLSHEQAIARPIEGCWSVLDCVEHIATAEERFLARIEGATRLETARIDPAREADISAKLLNRSSRVKAPGVVQPNGRFATLEEALDYFRSVRARTIRETERRSAELYLLEGEHPFFGKVNGKEMVLIVAGHTRRHTAQIVEIRQSLS